MNNLNPNKWIRDYSDAVRDFTFGDHDPASHLPFNAFKFYPLYFNLWMDKIYSAIKIIESKKISQKKIFANLPNYGSIKYIFYTFVNMSAYFNYDKEKAKTIFDFFIKYMLWTSKDKNLFNEKSSILKTKKEIGRIIPKLKVAGEKEKANISKLSGILAMYNHALYNDYSTEYGYFNEGPYKYKKHSLLIKNYPDLSPKELWPKLKNFKFKKIIVLALYKNTRLKMRFVTTHILADKDYAKNLFKYLVLLNGKPATGFKIEKLIQQIADKTGEIYLETKRYDFEKTKLKFLEQQAYELRWLFNSAGLNWRPDRVLIKKIKNKRLKTGFIKISYPKNKKEYEKYVGVAYLKKIYNL